MNPRIKLKKGMKFWECTVYEGKVEYYEWVVSSIQSRLVTPWSKVKWTHAYLSVKIQGLTWVKRSKKHFDYGWAKNIPSDMKKKVQIMDNGLADRLDLKFGLKYLERTKLKAAKKRLPLEIDALARYKEYKKVDEMEGREGVEEWDAVILEAEKDVRALKRQITRMENEAKRVNA